MNTRSFKSNRLITSLYFFLELDIDLGNIKYYVAFCDFMTYTLFIDMYTVSYHAEMELGCTHMSNVR